MAGAFISHRSSDKARAEALGLELTARGHRVWLDLWEIGIGDSIVARIDAGLADASHLVLCLSDDATRAPWMDREWMSALARQLTGAGITVLPARLTGGDPPAILADIRYADLVADWDAAVAELDRALRP
ncbi:toll/interleukin-1 receptor domain-containing protein [Streptomyces bambusae]|uniref:TIR domain-containing protein n=1 Tax=Streptomyces bambusae TaxID=1550616 RepID=A0ABS6Z4Z2_9ACTN|nr:toll/interleukin-1 receptor domain-containing protein [Streptomyces bambusae]MBW5482454.1 TIR domain-containing protein [Streptomyces bambusae]